MNTVKGRKVDLLINRKSKLKTLDSFEKVEMEDDQPRVNQAGQLGQRLPPEFRTAF